MEAPYDGRVDETTEPAPRRTPPRVRPSARRADEGGRLNIADIAKLAKVSTSAVSYALNGRPGISDATRARILAIAEEAKWRPNRAAQALSTARSGAIGIVTRYDDDTPLWSAGFGGRFLAGALQELSQRDVGLNLHQVGDVEAELNVYRRWLGERRVDGVLLINPEHNDPRLPLLESLGLPAVVVGDTRRRSRLPCVWTDDAAAAEIAVEHLASLGHRHIARIGRNSQQLHYKIRARAFRRALAARDLPVGIEHLSPDQAGAEHVRELATAAETPLTAIVVEDNEYAIQLVERLSQAGLSVPEDLSILSWDDSRSASLITPHLTALNRDIFDYGRRCIDELLRFLETGEARSVCGSSTELVVRDSTVPPRSERSPGADSR